MDTDAAENGAAASVHPLAASAARAKTDEEEGESQGTGMSRSSSSLSLRDPRRPRRASSLMPPEQEGSTPAAASANASKPKKHKVPVGWNGPIPLDSDPEKLVPAPQVTFVPGSNQFGQLLGFPMNRNGWRYDACVPASKELPWQVYKVADISPGRVHWSWQDRSPYMHINSDASEVSADNGFRSARANIAVREGCWYCEVEVLPPEELEMGQGQPGQPGQPAERSQAGPHVRIGWSRREASLNAPVGFDGYSYGYRDQTGERVTIARPSSYGKPYGVGDVIGLYIRLPKAREPDPKDQHDPARIRRVRVPIRFKGGLYYEMLDYSISKEMEFLKDESRRGARKVDEHGRVVEVAQTEDEKAAKRRKQQPGVVDRIAAAREKMIAGLRPVPVLQGSEIAFFKNGEPQGVAFRDIFDYRPLRRTQEEVDREREKLKKQKARAAAGFGGANEEAADILAGASTRTINKSRENHFDDGSTGYFPFVSCYGGARVRIHAGPDFRYPPPANIQAALHGQQGAGSRSKKQDWRPLSDRYDEWLDEQLKYDQAEEARAEAKQKRLAKLEALEKAQQAKAAASMKRKLSRPDLAKTPTGSASPAPEGPPLKKSAGNKAGGKAPAGKKGSELREVSEAAGSSRSPSHGLHEEEMDASTLVGLVNPAELGGLAAQQDGIVNGQLSAHPSPPHLPADLSASNAHSENVPGAPAALASDASAATVPENLAPAETPAAAAAETLPAANSEMGATAPEAAAATTAGEDAMQVDEPGTQEEASDSVIKGTPGEDTTVDIAPPADSIPSNIRPSYM